MARIYRNGSLMFVHFGANRENELIILAHGAYDKKDGMAAAPPGSMIAFYESHYDFTLNRDFNAVVDGTAKPKNIGNMCHN